MSTCLLLVVGITAAALVAAEENHVWTTWFNVDHPGGLGDYEQLDAIRFYYRTRVCDAPRALEARTTEWIPARDTGEKVHADPTVGFWCLNDEQGPKRNCSNYAVRFLCPKDNSVNIQAMWGLWSEWSACPALCDQVGVQIRSRTCQSRSMTCTGPKVEGKACSGPACPRTDCSLQCVMGRVNAECDRCTCEEHILLGAVRGAGGLVAAGAVIVRSGQLITLTDHNGHFRIPGFCPDGNNSLTISLQGHATVNIVVPHTVEHTSVVSIQLKRAEKLHVLSSPESKVRREGQSAAFCCKVSGTPQPDKYQWFFNNSLLEKQSESNLVLKDLHFEQAGEYYCRASGPSGAIKTKPATLKVIGRDEHSCNSKPESHLIRLPHDCYQNSTNSFYYDVGKCPTITCAGQLDNGIRCKDSMDYCCGVTKMQQRQLTCQGYQLPTMVVTECGCQKCVDTKAIVHGRAIAADNGEPMRFGHIFMNGVRISRTGYKGTFSIQIPPQTERLVLTFVDNMQKFVNTTKVLPFNTKGGAVYHEIKLLRKKDPVTINAAQTNTLKLGAADDQEPMVQIEIPPFSFYTQHGEVFTGNVDASVTFLDPRDISTAAAAQSDLSFVGNDGDTLPLRTYGMFSLDFRSEETNEPLNAGEVKVFLDSTQVTMPEHLNTMKLWSLNPETGLWEEEGNLQMEKKRRGKREERTFLIGNMEIRERRLFNLDVPENRRCYVKVRAFRSDRFMPSEQVEGVVVSLINMEPTAGYSTNPRAWGRFDSVITGPNGACLPAFCDEEKADAYSAYIMANLGGEELEAVSSTPKRNPGLIGVPQPYLGKLNYRRSDHEDPKVKKTAISINVAKPSPNTAEEGNGPVYAVENLKECEEALFSAAHFRFSRVEGDRYDYNTVPFNEDDPMSWTEDYLSWWPKPMEYRACYIKVKISGPHEINVRSRNMGGTHPKTVGQLYGLRDTRSIRDMDQTTVSAVCVEFKCSGMLYDQDRVDRTLVKVIPQGSCKRDHVNVMLQEYLTNHLPLAVNNDTSEFTMLAPLDPLGHNYGIYTVTDQDPRTAKEIALGRCFDGTSDGTSRVMKSNEGVALTFICGDREVTHQSVFQAVQSSQGQVVTSVIRGESRQNRRQRGGGANTLRSSHRRSTRNRRPQVTS
ncbi:cartilage intermediate layer protein 1 [Thalassophryne amazonica]|uniref:cartilage intermediate layer protein 1 n=1 Tax=Thalassophryne amazonica TaxID=390379 RepID=UPI0014712C7F|nr:cartilage intermediate layer protein 1 [Thalassophryne amazonica]XP_034047450.1 cartilage intermediate layer protein 1 [Thalassophryne amazonica]XP_034047458.1 cartilage intermediate layer protein 1 [Thalassophryne amazonica]XP_034047466.1 cartilage intermediate layer protein 1 [Thalassophryne amazonica]